MHLLVLSPISFINGVTPFQSGFVTFCATWIPNITIVWVLIFLYFRPIPNKCVFAPFENPRIRTLQLVIIMFSALAARFFAVILKNYFHIGRPFLLNNGLHPIIALTDYGFPSAHAAVFSAIAAALFLINRRAGIFAGLLALVIGAARIFAGVHTPLDIIGGYILGTLIAICVDFLAQIYQKKIIETV